MDQEWVKKDSDLPDRWDETSRVFVQPLRIESSEAFVQNVMRRVRTYAERNEWIQWPVFARWAYPVLALSIASFTVAVAYTLQPPGISTDTLLLGDQDQAISRSWLPNSPSVDQVLSSESE